MFTGKFILRSKIHKIFMTSKYKFESPRQEFVNMGNDPMTPNWCNFTMNFARKRIHCILSNIDFFGMRYHFSPFTVDLLQINCGAPSEQLFISIDNNQILLFIVLEGTLSAEFASIAISALAGGEFVVADLSSDHATINLGPGINSFLAITVEREWYLSVQEDHFPNGVPANVSREQGKVDIFRCGVGNKAEKWIKAIYRFSHLGLNAVDGNLRMNIALLLEYYFMRLESRKQSIAYSVKLYLDENYRDQGLSVRSVAAHFHVTERTLRNHFKKEFKQTVHRYYTQLRMQQANDLISVKGVQAKDIYDKLGYNDESTFRYAYTRYVREK